MSGDLGFGESGFGSSGYGYGDPSSTLSSPSPIFRQQDGTQGDCALIDPITRDFVLDARGNRVGWDSIRQKVYLALRTKKGTSCVTDVGIEFPTGTITGDIELRVKNAVNAALKPLTDLNEIQVVSILVQRNGQSGLLVQVNWMIVTTGQIVTDFI